METLIINMLIGYVIYKAVIYAVIFFTGRDLEQ